MCFLVIKSCGYIFMTLSASNIFYAAKVYIDFKKAFPKFPSFDLPFYTNKKFKKRRAVFSLTGF